MAAPQSINDNRQGNRAFDTTSFRSSMTSREGHVPARILDGKVIGVNMVNWTIDFASTFDRHRLLNIQMGGPYMHYSNGEGIYAMPEVGAKCTVCLPSDSSPPFVLCFLMPVEKVNDVGAPDAPNGTRSHGGVANAPTDARFDGGRPKAKPGDIFMRGRDGNFVILHRGGVLQIGANELSQRIFLPLENHMMDISERYSHHNVGGSMIWGLASGQEDQSVVNVETYRVYAEDKFADVRISKGKILNPMPPEGELEGDTVYEVVIVPKGFNADSGDFSGDGEVKYQFIVDRDGNVSTTVTGNFFWHIKKKLTLNIDEDMNIRVGAKASITADSGIDIDGGPTAHIKAGLVRLGKGDIAVAFKGGLVSTPIAPPGGAGTISLTGGTLVGEATLSGTPPLAGSAAIKITIGSLSAPMQMALAAPVVGTIVNGNEAVKV